MRTMLMIAAAAALATGAAEAATYGGKTVTVPATFSTRLAAVCQSQTFVLTAAAKTACTTGAFPRMTSAATAFVNSGTGAELNTLMRQLPPATLAAK